MKLKIIYDPDKGIGYPDGHCKNAAHSMSILRGEHTIGSQLLFDHIRLLVKKGVLPVDELEVWFGDIKICVDKNGRIAHWPKGFCDYFANTLNELLDWNCFN